MREELLSELAQRYTAQTYSLFDNNCNSFSDELATLLVGTGIPSHITALPAEVLATPFGQALRPALSGMEARLRSVMQAQQPLRAWTTESGERGSVAAPVAEAPAPAAARGAQDADGGRTWESGAVAAGEPPFASPRHGEGHEVVLVERELEAAVATTMMSDAQRAQHAEGATASVCDGDGGERGAGRRSDQQQGAPSGSAVAPLPQRVSEQQPTSSVPLPGSTFRTDEHPPTRRDHETYDAEVAVQREYARIRRLQPQLTQADAAALALERETARQVRLAAAQARSQRTCGTP